MNFNDYWAANCTGKGKLAAKRAFREFQKTDEYLFMLNVKSKVNSDWRNIIKDDFPLAPLPPAVPPFCDNFCDDWCNTKQEGKTPMRYNDNYATASASVATQPSDTAVTREYLLTRLAKADRPKKDDLTKLFNLYVDNTPKSYQAMFDAIKAGAYTIDKHVKEQTEAGFEENEDFTGFGPLHGIIWNGPKADYKGFEAAGKEQQKQYTAAKDTIMVGTAAEGLAAIKAFEAWLPTVGNAS